MEDSKIVELYWLRSERAIQETADKYGGLCASIAYNILRSREDAEECVNDTYLHAWNAMPPQRPGVLSAFVGRITRNLALHRYHRSTAKKRGGGQVPAALSELDQCLAGGGDMLEGVVIANVLNAYLDGLPAEVRNMFIQRYWFLFSIADIAAEHRTTESRVKSALYRARQGLRAALTEEGIGL